MTAFRSRPKSWGVSKPIRNNIVAANYEEDITIRPQDLIIEGNNQVGTDRPGFRESGSPGDYRLQRGSPLINYAEPRPEDFAQTDIVGNPRVVGGKIDVGAYESPVLFFSGFEPR